MKTHLAFSIILLSSSIPLSVCDTLLHKYVYKLTRRNFLLLLLLFFYHGTWNTYINYISNLISLFGETMSRNKAFYNVINE